MGLITEEVEVKIHQSNVKRLMSLGYSIPKHLDIKNKSKISIGESIKIKVTDLSDGSDYHVDVYCDECQKILNVSWDLFKQRNEKNNGYYCYNCAIHKYGLKNSIKTQNGRALKLHDWCIDNDRKDILDLWDYELNDLTPNDISFGTNSKYYFKCINGKHNSELKTIKTITRNKNNIVKCNSCGSFAEYLVDNYGDDSISIYWDYNKNTVSPWNIQMASSTKVYINCLCEEIHDSYLISCHSFSKGRRCQICAKNKNKSRLQNKVIEYLNSLNLDVLQEDLCTLKIRNIIQHKTMSIGYPLRYDCEIIINKKHILIEVHGEQHYKLTGFHNLQAKSRGTTPEYELEYQILKDKYKKQYAIDKGYFYLEIPHYYDNKNNDWKNLIDEKIKYVQLNDKEVQNVSK